MAYTSRDMRRYNHLLQETDAVYHEMAQHWGLSDSVMGVLYTLCDAGGRCRLREVWLSIVAAEVMAVITTAIFLVEGRKRYGY